MLSTDFNGIIRNILAFIIWILCIYFATCYVFLLVVKEKTLH